MSPRKLTAILTLIILLVLVSVSVGFFARRKTIQSLQRTQQHLLTTQQELKEAVGELHQLQLDGGYGACVRRNGLRTAIVGFVEDSVQRSQTNALAILNSENTSVAQKVAAQANLDQIKDYLQHLRKALPPESCPRPPNVTSPPATANTGKKGLAPSTDGELSQYDFRAGEWLA